MKPHTQNTRPKSTVQSPAHRRRARHLTALKHGLNSGSVLLPGDNVEAFRTLRYREFRLYRPRTIEEARCVETIVAAHWRIERCRVEQQIFKRHLGAVLSGHPDVSGILIDVDPHRLHHRATDCGLEERRLEKSRREAKTELALLQKQRVQNLIVGNEAELEDSALFLAEGEPRMAEGEPAEAEIASAPTQSTASADGEISKSLHLGSHASLDAFPGPGNRPQQSEAWHRQETQHHQESGP